jgi:hypothetical protein
MAVPHLPWHRWGGLRIKLTQLVEQAPRFGHYVTSETPDLARDPGGRGLAARRPRRVAIPLPSPARRACGHAGRTGRLMVQQAECLKNVPGSLMLTPLVLAPQNELVRNGRPSALGEGE